MPPRSPALRKPRAPEDSAQEILTAARALLHERPFRDLTVNAIMENTGLKRPSFYVHFSDLHDVVLRVLAEIADELHAMSQPWFDDDVDPVRSAHTAMTGIVDVYTRHGPVMKAVADAAADDAAVEAAYHAVIDHFVTQATQRIERDQKAGRVLDTDATRLARPLVLLIERYLSEALGHREAQTPPKQLVDNLHKIWVRSIYIAPGAGGC